MDPWNIVGTVIVCVVIIAILWPVAAKLLVGLVAEVREDTGDYDE